MFKYFILIFVYFVLFFGGCEMKIKDSNSGTSNTNTATTPSTQDYINNTTIYESDTNNDSDEVETISASLYFELHFNNPNNEINESEISSITLELTSASNSFIQKVYFSKIDDIWKTPSFLLENIPSNLIATVQIFDKNNQIIKETQTEITLSDDNQNAVTKIILFVSFESSSLPNIESISISVPDTLNETQDTNIYVTLGFSDFSEELFFEIIQDENSTGEFLYQNGTTGLTGTLTEPKFSFIISNENLTSNEKYLHYFIIKNSANDQKTISLEVFIPRIISGKAIDGYIATATTVITNLQTKRTIFETETSSIGEFQFSKPNDNEILVEISGGIDTFTNIDFAGKLKRVSSLDSDSSSMNVTPISSVVASLVEDGESIQNAESFVSTSLNISSESLNSDPIVLLKDGTREQQEVGAKMMKTIYQIDSLAQIVSTVSENQEAVYDSFFKEIGQKAKENRSIENILSSDGVSELLDGIVENIESSVEVTRIESIRELTKKTARVLEDINQTKLIESENSEKELINVQKSIEVFKVPLKERLSEIKNSEDLSEIEDISEDAVKVVNATIMLGGVDGIQEQIESLDENFSISDLVDEVLNDDEIDKKSEEYTQAIESGKTIDDLLNANNDDDNNETDSTDGGDTTELTSIVSAPQLPEDYVTVLPPSISEDSNDSLVLPPNNPTSTEDDSPPTTLPLDINSSNPPDSPDL
jgi:hypothetical protein